MQALLQKGAVPGRPIGGASGAGYHAPVSPETVDLAAGDADSVGTAAAGNQPPPRFDADGLLILEGGLITASELRASHPTENIVVSIESTRIVKSRQSIQLSCEALLCVLVVCACGCGRAGGRAAMWTGCHTKPLHAYPELGLPLHRAATHDNLHPPLASLLSSMDPAFRKKPPKARANISVSLFSCFFFWPSRPTIARSCLEATSAFC